MKGREKERLGLNGILRLCVGAAFILLLATTLRHRGPQPSVEEYRTSRSGVSMNTAIRISVTALDEREADAALDESFRLLESLNDQFSLFREESALARINRAAGDGPESVPPDVFAVVDEARKICLLTNGIFNPLVGPLTKLWKINRQPPSDAESADVGARMRFRLPDPASIDALLPLTRIENLELRSPDTVCLRQKGCMLDLGGIAKGYASLRLADLLRDRGIKSALIDLGGNIYAVGSQPDGSLWNIGIRDPLDAKGIPIAILSASDTAVVTSGTYERFKVIDGVRYSHFFDPSTGYPVRNALLSATLITPDGTLADALATAFMVMGPDRATEFLKGRPELGAILILSESEGSADHGGLGILATRNLEGRLRTSDPSVSVRFF